MDQPPRPPASGPADTAIVEETLFAELLREVERDALAAASSLREVTPDDRGRVALHDWIDQQLGVADRWNPMLRTFVEAESPGGPETRFGERVVRETSVAVGHRLRPGLPPFVNANMTAVAMLAMVDRFSHLSSVYDLGVGRETVVETLALVAFRMLYPAVRL